MHWTKQSPRLKKSDGCQSRPRLDKNNGQSQWTPVFRRDDGSSAHPLDEKESTESKHNSYMQGTRWRKIISVTISQLNKRTGQQKTLSEGIWPISNCASPNMISKTLGSGWKHLSILLIFSKILSAPSVAEERQLESLQVNTAYQDLLLEFWVVFYAISSDLADTILVCLVKFAYAFWWGSK